MEELEMEDLSNIITLTDEDGNGQDFEFLDRIEYEGGEFVVLLPCDEDDGMVVILEVKPIPGNEDEESYCEVENDEVLAAVFEIFKEKFSDTFNFED